MDADLSAQLDELNALGLEAAQALQSPWEPRCVARAFASTSERTFAFTMQTWIDLAAIRSPVLHGEWPENFAGFSAAGKCFGVTGQSLAALDKEEMEVMAEEMCLAIREAFSLRLKMRAENATEATDDGEGFGDWLIVFACLVTECGLAPDAAKALPVGQAFALVAAMLWHQGWQVAGEPYAVRDLAVKEVADDE